jgi:hypothetical protein
MLLKEREHGTLVSYSIFSTAAAGRAGAFPALKVAHVFI